jgi:hypothetical protein
VELGNQFLAQNEPQLRIGHNVVAAAQANLG